MGNPPDFYETLNIPKDSSSQQIRSAYRSLVKQWHPDKHPPSSKPEAEAKFKAISQAYEALNDQENRAVFGISNSAAVAATAAVAAGEMKQRRERPVPRFDSMPKFARTPAAARDFKDLYFSKGAAVAASAARGKPPPEERKLECTLEDLCRGCKKEIKFVRDVVGKNGQIEQKQESQTIKVKPGWKKGTKITFEGMGDERPGCLPSDVVFVITEKEHPIFKRVAHDLVLKVEIPLVSALTGWTFSFRLLTGERMTCSFRDEIVHPGYEKIIRGQGMPVANDKGKRGDLRIKFHIVFPTQLSSEQRSSIAEVLKGCS